MFKLNWLFTRVKSLTSNSFFCNNNLNIQSQFMVITKFKSLFFNKRYYSTNIKNKYALGNKESHPKIVESYYNSKTNTVDLIAVNVTHSSQTFYEGKGYIN